MNDYAIDDFSKLSDLMMDYDNIKEVMEAADMDNLNKEELREEVKARLLGEPSPRVYRLMKQLMGEQNVKEIKRKD